MKRLLATIACLFATQLAFAEPASEASIVRLLELTGTEAAVESMFGSLEGLMREGMQHAVAGKTLTAQQRKVLDFAPARMVVLLRQELSWDSLKADYIEIYRQTFDQAEVDGLIEFYSSPAGRAFVAKMPAIVQKSIARSQARMKEYLPRVTRAMDEALREAGLKP